MKTNSVYYYNKAAWHYVLITTTTFYAVLMAILTPLRPIITSYVNDHGVLANLAMTAATFFMLLSLVQNGLYFKKSLYRFGQHQARWRKKTFFSDNKWISEYKHVQHVTLRQNVLQRHFNLKSIRCHTPSTTIHLSNFDAQKADQLFLHITTYMREYAPKQTDCPQCA